MDYSRRARSMLAVIAILMGGAVLAPAGAAAASCSGKSHTMSLSAGTVSPTSGHADDRFTFSVVYADNGGCAPTRITVMIAGLGTFALTQAGGDLTTGATFQRKISLPAGSWSYAFEATSGAGVGERTSTLSNPSPRQVVVLGSTPSPRPTPGPTTTPRPTPGPTTTPRPTPSPTAGPSHPPSPMSSDGSPASASPSPASPMVSLAGRNPGVTAQPSAAAAAAWTGAGPRPASLSGPWIALVVSGVGTAVGLVLFSLLSSWLVEPGQGDALAAWRRGEGWPPLPPRSKR